MTFWAKKTCQFNTVIICHGDLHSRTLTLEPKTHHFEKENHLPNLHHIFGLVSCQFPWWFTWWFFLWFTWPFRCSTAPPQPVSRAAAPSRAQLLPARAWSKAGETTISTTSSTWNQKNAPCYICYHGYTVIPSIPITDPWDDCIFKPRFYHKFMINM